MSVCDFPPFRYQSVPQPQLERGASSSNINEQMLEQYIARLVAVLCTDRAEVLSRLAAIESRLDALESP